MHPVSCRACRQRAHARVPRAGGVACARRKRIFVRSWLRSDGGGCRARVLAEAAAAVVAVVQGVLKSAASRVL